MSDKNEDEDEQEYAPSLSDEEIARRERGGEKIEKMMDELTRSAVQVEGYQDEDTIKITHFNVASRRQGTGTRTIREIVEIGRERDGIGYLDVQVATNRDDDPHAISNEEAKAFFNAVAESIDGLSIRTGPDAGATLATVGYKL